MLRAMREALQAHAAAHPGEPFDHERHMPACMREARDDPATWASGGSRGGGGSNEEARHLEYEVVSPIARARMPSERSPTPHVAGALGCEEG